MPELDLTLFLIVCPLVFLGSFVDAIAGGGGLITLPAYLIAGVPPHMAIGTNKLSSWRGDGRVGGEACARGLHALAADRARSGGCACGEHTRSSDCP